MNHSFNPQQFAENMSAQAKDMLPADISQEAKSYTIKTIENFVILAGEALVNDKSLTLTAENQQAICQILAEWIYHKSVDLAHSEISQENWDSILQKVAFTVFEIAKQGYIRDVSQEDILAAVEHHVNKSFKESLKKLSNDNKITEEIQEKALKESNIDKMAAEYVHNNPKKENNKNFVLYSILKFVEPIIKIITYPFLFIKYVIAHIIKLYPFRSLMILSIFIIFKLTSKEIAENFTFSNFETLVYAVLILATLKIIFLTFKDWVNADVQNQLNQLEETKRNMEELVNPDRQFDRLGVDILSLSVGQGLLPIADPDNDEGTLLAGITALRQQLTDALGYILPKIRVMDTYGIDDYEYSIFVRENKIANGFVYLDKYMVIAEQWDSIVGEMPQNYICGVEPVWNADCYWVEKYEIKEIMKKYPDIIAISPTDAIVEHIRAIVIKYVDSIIMTCDIEKYIKRVKKEENTEKLLESLQERLDLEDIRKIFVNLLREEISIKDIMYIFDRLNSYAKYTQNPDILSERLRADLGTRICLKHSEEKVLYAVSLSQKLEEFLDGKLFKTETSTKFLLNPAEVKDLVETFATTRLKVAKETDKKSVILCSPNIRLPLYQLLVNQIPSIVVISYSELVSDIKVEVLDTIDKK